MAQTIKLKRSGTSGRLPTTSDLELGEVAINTYDGKMYIKKNVGGTESIVEIGASGGGLASSFTLYEYTASASQTTFSGSDSNSNTLAYDTGTPPKILVYLNGVLLDHTTDYTATNGTSVVLTSAAAASDLVQIAAYKSTITSDQDIDLDDNQKILLGDDDDLQIYHDGTHSYIDDAGTGGLYLRSDNFRVLKGDGSERMIQADDDGAVLLYYDGSAKIQTTNDGVTVTGDVEADEFIGDVRGAVLFKAQAGEALSKGDVVYISGISGNTTIVSKADADDASKMPAFGLVAAAASSGNPVDIYTNGILSGIDTSSYSEGDELFVSTTAGALTATAPTGESAALQKIGKVTRSASSGSIFIVGAGRTNAVPNLNEGKLFVGNSSNQAVADDTVHVDIANSHVGIGTTSPNYPLHVVSSDNNHQIRVERTGTGNVNLGVDTVGAFVEAQSSIPLRFYESNAERMRIDGGNVGIGTDSPSATLHVVNSSTNGEVLRLTTTGDEPDRSLFLQSDHVYSSGNLYLGNGSTGQNLYRATYHSFYYGSGNTLGMTLSTSGNLGVGVSSPAGVLDVTGTYGDFKVGDPSVGSRLTYYGATRVLLDSNNIVFYTNSLTERMRIHNAGGLSIGTTSAAGNGGLLVDNDIKTNSRIGIGSAGNTSTPALYNNSDTDTGVYWPAANTLGFVAGGTEHARIDSSGHVLIGTTDTTPYNNSADSTADRGIVLRAEGYISAAAYQQSALDINRTGNNGNVVNFYRSGASAGSISVNDGYIGVGAGAVYLGYYTDGSNNKSIIPMGNSTGAAAAGTIGLGINNANHKFKDAWITGAVNCGSISSGAITSSASVIASGNSNSFGNTTITNLSATSVTTSGSITASGNSNSFGNITTTGYLRGPSTFTIDPATHGDNTGTVVIAGNLQVDGTTTTINSTTLTVDDLNITLASGSSNAAAANGAGITVDCGSGTDATLTYNGTLDTWEFNKRVDVTSEVRLFRSDGTRSGSLLHNTSGTVLRTNSNGDNLYLQTAGTGNVYLQPSTAGYSTVVNEDGIDSDFRVESDGNTHAFFVDAGNSRLGINTSSLTADGLIIGTTNNNCELDLHNTGTNGTRWRLNSSAQGHFTIENKTESTIPFTILDTSGNVGIGTTSPAFAFHAYHATTNVVSRFESGDSQVWIDLHDSNSGTYGALLGHDGNAGQLFMVADQGVNRRFIIDTAGQVSIGTNVNPVARLQVEELGIDTTTTSTTATTQVAIDTFAAATFRSARYTIQVTNSTDSTYHLTEVLLIHDGTTPQITEYGTIFTGSAEATFDADISSGNVRLLATPATTDSMTFKVVRHCITV